MTIKKKNKKSGPRTGYCSCTSTLFIDLPIDIRSTNRKALEKDEKGNNVAPKQRKPKCVKAKTAITITNENDRIGFADLLRVPCI